MQALLRDCGESVKRKELTEGLGFSCGLSSGLALGIHADVVSMKKENLGKGNFGRGLGSFRMDQIRDACKMPSRQLDVPGSYAKAKLMAEISRKQALEK